MQISFSHDMLAVTIEDDTKTFYHIQNIIEKNFSKKVLNIPYTIKRLILILW